MIKKRVPLATEQIKNVRAWIADLRSGKFPQAGGALRLKIAEGRDGYCCLGVACATYHRLTGRGNWTPPDPGKDKRYFLFGDTDIEASMDLLPHSVALWLFGEDKAYNNPNLYGKTNRETLATRLNDNLDYTFAEIADAIERTYPEVKAQ